MKVSVIIPTYKEEKVILDCLESLGKQTYPDFEIIVVDDGSTDKTLEILKRTQELTKKITVLTQNHKGAGAARNLGAEKATGEILVFVDADMTFAADFLEKLVEPIVGVETISKTWPPSVIGTFSKEEYLANKNNPWARSWNLNRGLPATQMHPANYPDSQPVFRAILKTEFEKAGGFDTKAGYTDDYLASRVGQMAVAAPGAIFYHQNPDTLKEVFSQSKWMAKRKYKLGVIGTLIALGRVSLPVSLLVGLAKSIYFGLPQFLIFKIVSDVGAFVGIMEYALKGNVAK